MRPAHTGQTAYATAAPMTRARGHDPARMLAAIAKNATPMPPPSPAYRHRYPTRKFDLVPVAQPPTVPKKSPQRWTA